MFATDLGQTNSTVLSEQQYNIIIVFDISYRYGILLEVKKMSKHMRRIIDSSYKYNEIGTMLRLLPGDIEAIDDPWVRTG